MTHYLVIGNTGAKVKATITREDDGLPVDLGSKTTVMSFRKKGTPTVLFTLTGIDSNPSAGETIFSFETNLNTLAPGFYEGEITVTNADSTTESIYELINFKAREPF